MCPPEVDIFDQLHVAPAREINSDLMLQKDVNTWLLYGKTLLATINHYGN